jgi:hypothetical protein
MLWILHKSRRLCYLLIVCLLVPSVSFARSVTDEQIRTQNVRFQVVGTKIIIRFDLEGPQDRDYTIKLTLKREQNQSFVHIPRAAAGDIGEGRFAGKDRQISWDILKEFSDGLEGNDYYFVIEVELISRGMSPLWYVGGGLAIVGGVAAFLLGKTAPASPAATESFPKPIGRPTGY